MASNRSATPAGFRSSRSMVTALEKDMPGALAGLQVGDEIMAVDGKPIHATGAMQAYLQTTKDKPVHLEILRHNASRLR